MPSKYAKFKGKLDPWKPEPAYQERVEEEKKCYIALSPVELARQLQMSEEEKYGAEAKIKNINLSIEALSQLLVSALENSSMQSIELESGMKCSLDIKPYASVLPEKAEEYEKWMRSPGIRPLLTLNAQTRDGLVRELLESGKPMFSWAKVFLKTRAKLTGKRRENSNEEVSNETSSFA